MKMICESPDDPERSFPFECEAVYRATIPPHSDDIKMTREQADAFAREFNRVMHPEGDAEIRFENGIYVYDLKDGLNRFEQVSHHGFYYFTDFYCRPPEEGAMPQIAAEIYRNHRITITQSECSEADVLTQCPERIDIYREGHVYDCEITDNDGCDISGAYGVVARPEEALAMSRKEVDDYLDGRKPPETKRYHLTVELIVRAPDEYLAEESARDLLTHADDVVDFEVIYPQLSSVAAVEVQTDKVSETW